MKTHQNNEGFTLIEAVIAIAVLSIGILALNTMQSTTIRGNAQAQAITEASNAARGRIEQFLLQDFDDPELDDGVAHTNVGISPITSIDWIVTDWITDGIDNDIDGRIDEFDERGVKSVQLTVQYTDMGIAKSSMLQFLKTEIL